MVDRYRVWLGAGFLAGGMSAAMLTGAGIATADDGASAGSESQPASGSKDSGESDRDASGPGRATSSTGADKPGKHRKDDDADAESVSDGDDDVSVDDGDLSDADDQDDQDADDLEQEITDDGDDEVGDRLHLPHQRLRAFHWSGTEGRRIGGRTDGYDGRTDGWDGRTDGWWQSLRGGMSYILPPLASPNTPPNMVSAACCAEAAEGDAAGAAGLAYRDIGHLFFSRWRATITRMISFVPSRI